MSRIEMFRGPQRKRLGLGVAIGGPTNEVLRHDEESKQAERTLESVNAATSTLREQLVQVAANLAKTERSMDRLSATVAELTALQAEIDDWRQEAKSALEADDGTSDLAGRLRSFRLALQKYLVELGHSAIVGGNVEEVRLGDDYVPYVGHRPVRSLGSASDRPRVVAAYTMALAASSRTVGGLHPGVVVMDEPLQQNPDEAHRSLFAECLKSEALTRKSEFQTIIFTSLRASEVEDLRAHGTNIVTPRGERFLKRDESEGA